MAIDERARHRLYDRLEAVLGPEEATILMEHLPPVGWVDVATKRDLDALGHRMEAAWRAEINQQTRTMILAMITVVTTVVLAVAGLAFAAVRLT